MAIYAGIAAHRAMCSLFLRLNVNDVMSAPVVVYRNKESVSDLSVSGSVHILANNALRAHHASAHGGLSANVLSYIFFFIHVICFFEMILLSCLKLCLR